MVVYIAGVIARMAEIVMLVRTLLVGDELGRAVAPFHGQELCIHQELEVHLYLCLVAGLWAYTVIPSRRKWNK